MSIPTIDQARLDQFGREDFNRVPVVREVMADLDTPLSTYLKLGKQPLSYLLESVFDYLAAMSPLSADNGLRSGNRL